MLKSAKLKILGKVQGVCFRDATQKKAIEFALAGWVRNAPDGTVEAYLEGPMPAIEQMIAWCRQGSPSANVDKVEVEWAEPEGCEGFEVRY